MSDPATAEVSGIMPPLYTMWVAGVFGLFGVESRLAIFVLEGANALALAVACGLVFKIAEALSGRRAAWMAGLIAALNPALIGHTNYVWDTSFFALAVTLSVWISVLLRNTPFRSLSFFGFGIWLGIVALLNPALTLVYPLLILFPLWQYASHACKIILRGVVLSVLGWMIAITPWTIRNYVRFDKLQYIRSGFMLEVWLGVTPEAETAGSEVYRNHFPLNNPEVARHVAEIGEKQYLEESGDNARQAIAEDPARFARLCLKRTIDYWMGSVFTHAGPQNKVIPATRQRQLIMLVFTAEVVLVLLGILIGRLRCPEGLWLLSIVVGFSLVYSITHVQVRFRVPTEPLIAVLVGLTLTSRISACWRSPDLKQPPDHA